MAQISKPVITEDMRGGVLRVLRELKQVQLGELLQVHPTAQMQGKTECCRSGVCCWRRPGEVREEDLPRLAEGLGISQQELFQKYLLVDRVHGILLLRLRRRHELAGRMLGWLATWSMESPCVFLDEVNRNTCQVHKFKPAACQSYKCWERSKAEMVGISEECLRALGWDGHDRDGDSLRAIGSRSPEFPTAGQEDST